MIPAIGVTVASLCASDYLFEVRQKHNFKERASAMWYALPQVGLASFTALTSAWYNGWSSAPYCLGAAGILITPGVVRAVINRHFEKKSDQQQEVQEREIQRLREIEENKQKARDAMPFLLATNIHQKDPSDIADALHNLQYADENELSSLADKLTVGKINDLLAYVQQNYFCASDLMGIYNELPRLLCILQKRLASHDFAKVDTQKMLRRHFDVDKSKVSEISEIKLRTILPVLHRFVPEPFDNYSNFPFPERLALLIAMYPGAMENIVDLLQARADRERIALLPGSGHHKIWMSLSTLYGHISLGEAHKLKCLLRQGLREYQARVVRGTQEIKETEPVLFHKYYTIIEQ